MFYNTILCSLSTKITNLRQTAFYHGWMDFYELQKIYTAIHCHYKALTSQGIFFYITPRVA